MDTALSWENGFLYGLLKQGRHIHRQAQKIRLAEVLYPPLIRRDNRFRHIFMMMGNLSSYFKIICFGSLLQGLIQRIVSDFSMGFHCLKFLMISNLVLAKILQVSKFSLCQIPYDQAFQVLRV